MERGLVEWPLEYGLADIAYAPWLIRLRDMLGFDLSPYPALEERLGELTERPAIAAELGVVAALSR
jgi:glutathione S-transferase